MHKLSGDHLLKAQGLHRADGAVRGPCERLGRHGEMRMSVVLSPQYEGPTVGKQGDDFLHPPQSKGWNRDQEPEVRAGGNSSPFATAAPWPVAG